MESSALISYLSKMCWNHPFTMISCFGKANPWSKMGSQMKKLYYASPKIKESIFFPSKKIFVLCFLVILKSESNGEKNHLSLCCNIYPCLNVVFFLQFCDVATLTIIHKEI